MQLSAPVNQLSGCFARKGTCRAVTRRSFVPGPPELKGAVISSTGVAAEASQARTLPSASQHLVTLA